LWMTWSRIYAFRFRYLTSGTRARDTYDSELSDVFAYITNWNIRRYKVSRSTKSIILLSHIMAWYYYARYRSTTVNAMRYRWKSRVFNNVRGRNCWVLATDFFFLFLSCAVPLRPRLLFGRYVTRSARWRR